jgi:hypothetical protein
MVHAEVLPNTTHTRKPDGAVPTAPFRLFHFQTSNRSLFATTLANNVPAYANELPTLGSLTRSWPDRVGQSPPVLATSVDITQKPILCLTGRGADDLYENR